jgi:hypothetical protein
MSARDIALADAFTALMQGKGAEAQAAAEPFADDWLARAIRFLAFSFFLHEPGEAMALYGGVDAFQRMAASETVERYFMRGLGAIFRKERANASSRLARDMKHPAFAAAVRLRNPR